MGANLFARVGSGEPRTVRGRGGGREDEEEEENRGKRGTFYYENE
jgi:hypothetical protein